MFLVAGVLAVAAIAAIGLISYHLTERKAVQVAQEYLAQKYDQEMRYESIRFSWFDPSLYYVGFSPANNANIHFEVMVQQNLTIDEEWTNNEGDHFSPDNYYIARFEYFIVNYFQNEAKRIWGDNVSVIVRVPNEAIYSFKIPENLSDKMSMYELDNLIGEYLILIDIKQSMQEALKEDEATEEKFAVNKRDVWIEKINTLRESK